MDYIFGSIKYYVENTTIDFRIYKAILVFICFLIVLCMIVPNQKISVKIIHSFVIVYLFIVFSLAVLVRPDTGMFESQLSFLWTYRAIASGKDELIYEILENIVLLMPVGFSLGIMNCISRPEQRAGFITSVVAAILPLAFIGLFSTAIELCQYYLNVGLAEFDDIFHNFIGGLTGYILAIPVMKIVNLIKKNISAS